MDEKILVETGLSEKEARVYLALLELGSTTSGAIIAKTKLHKATVYSILERLKERGLVGFIIKEKGRYYEAVKPERLLELEKEKLAKIQLILPELERKRKLGKVEQEAYVYQGKAGIKTILNDIIKIKQSLFIFGAKGNFGEILKHDFVQWQKRRVKEKISAKIIYSVAGKTTKEEFPLTEIRCLSENYMTSTTTGVYGDRVVLIIWSKEPLAILIKSKEIANSFRNQFTLLWKMAKILKDKNYLRV